MEWPPALSFLYALHSSAALTTKTPRLVQSGTQVGKDFNPSESEGLDAFLNMIQIDQRERALHQ